MPDTKDDDGSGKELEAITKGMTPLRCGGYIPRKGSVPEKADRTPNWNKWRLTPKLTPLQCAALWANIDPHKVGHNRYGGFDESREFQDRLELIEANLYDELKSKNGKVDRRLFAAWARETREKGWDAPDELLAMADEQVALEEAENRLNPKAEGKPRGDADSPKWPWGSHETELLRHLAAAAVQFWKDYDPSDPKTAPLNKSVVGWLEDQGVSARNAAAIATILRADGLRTGPRK